MSAVVVGVVLACAFGAYLGSWMIGGADGR